MCGAVGLALCALSGAARADGYGYAAPAAPAEERKFTWSFNIDGTSDYIFRGISQTDNDPAIQGGLDASYGILYAGWWASQLDFEAALNDAQVEMDWYGGIRPKWHNINFDFGVIYYSYPGATYFTSPFNTHLTTSSGRRARAPKSARTSSSAAPSISPTTTSRRRDEPGRLKARRLTRCRKSGCSPRPSTV